MFAFLRAAPENAPWSVIRKQGFRRLLSFRGRRFSCDLVGSSQISGPALPGDSLYVLHQQNRELRAKIKSLAWPRMTSFEVQGRTYTLPWRSSKSSSRAQLSLLTQDELSYLAGFFDGDGCVKPYASLASCTLDVGQSCDGAEALMVFAAAFGGSIGRLNDGRGLTKPTLQWCVHGLVARRAAGLLLPHAIVKRRQLQIAYDWTREQGGREERARELRHLKRFDSAEARIPNLSYFTGFFDAEGCILRGRNAGLRLSLSQKHPTVLECLQSVLASEMGIQASLLRTPSGFCLLISQTSRCKQLLAKMLHCGMIRKAQVAKLALGLTLSNAPQVRASMAELVGNQKFGKRLDQAGVDRAAKISSLRRRARSARKQEKLQEAAALQEEIYFCTAEHVLLKAQAENYQLQEYVHKMLTLQTLS